MLYFPHTTPALSILRKAESCLQNVLHFGALDLKRRRKGRRGLKSLDLNDTITPANAFHDKGRYTGFKKSRQIYPSCTNTKSPGHRTIFVALQSLTALTNCASFEKGKLC